VEAGAAEGVVWGVAIAGEEQGAVDDAGRAHTEHGPGTTHGERGDLEGMLGCAGVDEDLSGGGIGCRALKGDYGLWLAIAGEIAKDWPGNCILDKALMRAAVCDFDNGRLVGVTGEDVGEIAPVHLL
jgi:hypothetical protein